MPTAARKAAKAAPAKTATAPVASEPSKFDWDAMPEAESGKEVSVRTDVETTTPEGIKARVRESYNAYMAIAAPNSEVNAATGLRQGKLTDVKTTLTKASREGYRTQKLPDEATATEFFKLMKRYCQGRAERLTLRGGPMEKDKSKVRFLVKPFEQRERD